MMVFFFQDGKWNASSEDGSPADKALMQRLAMAICGNDEVAWVPSDGVWHLGIAINWAVERLGSVGPGGEDAYQLYHRFLPACEDERDVIRGLLTYFIGGVTVLDYNPKRQQRKAG